MIKGIFVMIKDKHKMNAIILAYWVSYYFNQMCLNGSLICRRLYLDLCTNLILILLATSFISVHAV